jgi:hypothetical protein
MINGMPVLLLSALASQHIDPRDVVEWEEERGHSFRVKLCDRLGGARLRVKARIG